ncbi:MULTISPECIES: rolling circle replication-associated protein [Bacteria]|uniref:Uncharacterized protein n=1 Tax=Planomonospora alba TaxID=161354 RepID=A0ABP6NYH9_9ACTN|nr:hypothetical protein [Sulfolobus islandicus]
MDLKKVLNFHFSYTYTYFITIATNYKYGDTEKIFKKFRSYIYNHDKNSHVFSIKETTKNSNGLHYHILVFTNKKLDYSRVHKHMPPHTDIRIELIPKNISDIKNVYKYMIKTKKDIKMS